jgi:hypothetical protein
MFGAILHNMLLAIGLKKAPPASPEATPPVSDDFVARHGLSYGEAPEPLPEEASSYIQRLKTFRRTR